MNPNSTLSKFLNKDIIFIYKYNTINLKHDKNLSSYLKFMNAVKCLDYHFQREHL